MKELSAKRRMKKPKYCFKDTRITPLPFQNLFRRKSCAPTAAITFGKQPSEEKNTGFAGTEGTTRHLANPFVLQNNKFKGLSST